MKIIGCGNPKRGDDDAGPLVIRRLQGHGIEAETVEGDTLDFLQACRQEDAVIVIDAVVTGAPPGTVFHWDADDLSLPHKPTISTHGLGLAESIQLGRVLGCLPRRLQVFGIEAREFAVGASMSQEVRKAAETLADRIATQMFHRALK
ncbi:MAG TPA: hydrogenase maturation protease [Terriglobales bacterium]|nr:hydrogenase maturation protease [Terriglobales bacterium]